MLTRPLYKLLGENPERAWATARHVVTPLMGVLAPSWGYGHELLPAEGGAIVAVNHFSGIDPTLLGVHSRRALYYMAKIELLSLPVAGEILRWMGAFAVRRGEGDRESLRVARWLVRAGHVVGLFAEGTRQRLGYPGPLHTGAAMVALQEGMPIVPCGIDTFGWSFRNRRRCCVVWGEPLHFDLPRTGAGYKEATVEVERRVHALWRQAAQAVADGFPPLLASGLRRGAPLSRAETVEHPELVPWPEEEWAARPLGPVYRRRAVTSA